MANSIFTAPGPAFIESLESRTLLSDSSSQLFVNMGSISPPGDSVVRGRVFDDLNNNGIFDSSEKVLGGVRVTSFKNLFYLEKPPRPTTTGPGFPPVSDHAGTSRVTDQQGEFIFDELPASIYALEITASRMPLDSFPISIELGATEEKIVDIPAHPFNVISGRIAAYRERDTYIVDKLRIYLDRNNNGKLDYDEDSLVTDDSTYHFDHVLDGPYVVRVITDRRIMHLPHGVVSHDTVATDDIELDYRMAFVKLRIYLDKNRNGMRDLGEPMLRRVIFDVDYNQNGLIEADETFPDRHHDGRYGFYLYFRKTRITIRNPQGSGEKFSGSITLRITDFKPTKHRLVGVQPRR